MKGISIILVTSGDTTYYNYLSIVAAFLQILLCIKFKTIKHAENILPFYLYFRRAGIC